MRISGAILLCVLSTAGLAAAEQTPASGRSLLDAGVTSFRAGDFAAAEEKLTAAADELLSTDQMQKYVETGKIDTLPDFEKALIYLALTEIRLGNDEDAKGALLRLVTAERIEPHYANLALEPDALEFESVAARLMPDIKLPPNESLAQLRAEGAQVAEATPPPPAAPVLPLVPQPEPVPVPVPRATVAEVKPAPAPLPPPPARAPDTRPATGLMPRILGTQAAAERNDRDAFQASLADLKRSVASAPGDVSAVAELVAVYDDIDRLWDYQYNSPTGSFFDEGSEDGALVAMMRKYSDYQAYVRDQMISTGGRRIYPTMETREFLNRQAGRRVARMVGVAPSVRPQPQPTTVRAATSDRTKKPVTQPTRRRRRKKA